MIYKEDFTMKNTKNENTKNEMKKRFVSLFSALLIGMTAVAGFGSTACAKQAPDIAVAACAKQAPDTAVTACAKQAPDTAVAAKAAESDKQVDPIEAIIEMFLGPDSGYSNGDDSVGKTVSFETKDLNGNPVNSADLLRDKKVTMINFWATWCPHCVEELPELQELSKELEAQGCQMIGVCEDADDSGDDARQILSENGVTYTNIELTKQMYPMMPHKAIPTTYFVGSDGKILTKPVIGKNLAEYHERLAEALAIVEQQ